MVSLASLLVSVRHDFFSLTTNGGGTAHTPYHLGVSYEHSEVRALSDRDVPNAEDAVRAVPTSDPSLSLFGVEA